MSLVFATMDFVETQAGIVAFARESESVEAMRQHQKRTLNFRRKRVMEG